MNKPNRFKHALALGAVVVGMIALAALLTTPVASAQRDDNVGDPHRAVNVMPPVGIAFGQTLRVTFLNVGSNPLEIIPCIFDSDGAHLKTGELLTLASGQMRSFDLSRSEIGGRTENSVEVRAGVHADRPDLRHLMVAGEVIEDTTGKSSLYVPGQSDPPDPVRDGRVTSTLTTVGIVAGQTLRVTFLNEGRNPLEIIPCVFDSDGAHLKEGETMTLAPGQMRSLELSWSEAAGGRTETRVQMRGAAHLDRRGAKHLVMAGEVVEDATGKSSLYVPGQSNPPDPVRDGRVTSTLGPVGIAAGQTLRVTFLNLGNRPFEFDPCFFDGDGAHLKEGETITLAPGQMRSLELSWSEAVGGRTESSVEVRGAAHVDRRDAKHLVMAGELVEDATAKSSLYVPAGVAPPDPVRDGRVTSSLGPVGIVAGQTLRVTFLNVGRNPVELDPCFFDSDGAHLKEGETMTLAPAQMRSLELSWSEAAGGRTETRVQMRGAAHVNRNDARHLVMAGELVEDATGKSSLYVPPPTP